MNTQYRCQNENRRRLVAEQAPPKLNGIDYLEVASADQKTLRIFFLHNLPGQPGPVPSGPALTKNNVVIEGGVRVEGVGVSSAVSSGKTLTVTVDKRGDFSTYTLRIVASRTGQQPPPGFDPQLSAAPFSFKVDCPSEFDCERQVECPPDVLIEPELSYLAKDYASFRRLMLDRLSVIMPDWRERNPADAHIALIELLAYVGDHLSYYQDAVATEAYLGAARRRISARRHARLLDYRMHDGCNARAWVFLEVAGDADGKTLPVGTTLLTRGEDGERVFPASKLNEKLTPKPHPKLNEKTSPSPTVFETMHDLRMIAAHNSVGFYTWGDDDCCLPARATRATLLDANDGLSLRAGDVLIFEEARSPITGLTADADPSRRHAVRLKEVTPTVDPLNNKKLVEIVWHEADALPFPLCLTARISDESGSAQLKEVSVARGNVVLADHGLTRREALAPDSFGEGERYQPQLQHTGISFSEKYDHDLAQLLPAAKALRQDPQNALPSGADEDRLQPMSLWDGDEVWIAQRELLGSDRFKADFVAEVERDGRVYLRFGDGVLGKQPAAGSRFAATYRIGNGRAGNVGADSITRIATGFTGILGVRNPLPAAGGVEAETMEEARQYAPQAFRTQERAVTEADYAEVTERHAEVQKAAATFRWTGSWHTVFITIDRKGGLSVRKDPLFLREIRRHIERYRMAGYDLEINDPIPVPLEIKLQVCVKQGYFRSNVKQSLLSVFGNRDLPDGRRGFFHPDNFTFGQPLYLSRIYETAMAVAGVSSVEVKIFQRQGQPPGDEIKTGVLTPQALEIIQLDNDPNFPENGKIEFDTQGGL
jgi:Baseplate J-like protein